MNKGLRGKGGWHLCGTLYSGGNAAILYSEKMKKKNWENVISLGHRPCTFYRSPAHCRELHEATAKSQPGKAPLSVWQNEWQYALNTTSSCHHRRNSRTWTKGSDRLSREEIALSLIGWLGAAGAQISRFQEESGLVKWTGTVCALCARAPCVCLACVLHPYMFKRAGLCRSLCVHMCSKIREAGSISKVHL